MKNVTINQIINQIKEQKSLFNSELKKVKFVETDEQDKVFLTDLGAIFSEKNKRLLSRRFFFRMARSDQNVRASERRKNVLFQLYL